MLTTHRWRIPGMSSLSAVSVYLRCEKLVKLFWRAVLR